MKSTHLVPTPFSRLLLALTAASFCLANTVCSAETVVGSGHVVSETRNVSGFHGVDLGGSGEVIVTQGDQEGLVIEAEDNLLPFIESKVDGSGVLHLGYKNHVSIESSKGTVYKLSVKTLDKVAIEGSGSLRAAALTVDHLDLDLPGSGDIVVDHLKAATATTAIEGSGKVKLAGAVRRQQISIDGSGDYEAKDLKTDVASVEINGSGEGRVWAGESLAVEINGSGSLDYYGNPSLKKSVNGSGEVSALGTKNG